MNFTNKDELKIFEGQPGRLPVFIISGKAGAGKTTIANMMLTTLSQPTQTPYRFKQSVVSFATPIKECAREYFGWDGKKDEKGRRLLQKLGTEVGREYNQNIWADKLLSKIDNEEIYLTHNAIFIDDWRFENEYEVLKKQPILYVISMRIIRPDIPENNHLSEQSLSDLDRYDVTVRNVGNLEDLQQIARIIIEKYYGGIE